MGKPTEWHELCFILWAGDKEMFKLISAICTPLAVPLVLGLMSLWWVTRSCFDRFATVSFLMANGIMGSAPVEELIKFYGKKGGIHK